MKLSWGGFKKKKIAIVNEILGPSSHTPWSNSPWNISTGRPLQMQWVCSRLSSLCQRPNHAIECVTGVSAHNQEDKIQHVFPKLPAVGLYRWFMTVSCCIGHHEIDS